MGDKSEFRGQHDGVASAFERSADEFLVGLGPVHLGAVDEGHTEVDGALDCADGLSVVAASTGVRE